MGRYYDVPSRAGGSLSDAELVDYQAGAESAMVGAVTRFADVDPAGHFLDRRHTVEHSREGCFHPELFDRRSHGDWHEDGRKSSFERAHDRVGRLLADYERPPLDADVEREPREYVETARKRAG
jgi:trimethylamine--corrinoid protein Co-methyltransferase